MRIQLCTLLTLLVLVALTQLPALSSDEYLGALTIEGAMRLFLRPLRLLSPRKLDTVLDQSRWRELYFLANGLFQLYPS